jgi:hypothetical protein
MLKIDKLDNLVSLNVTKLVNGKPCIALNRYIEGSTEKVNKKTERNSNVVHLFIFTKVEIAFRFLK